MKLSFLFEGRLSLFVSSFFLLFHIVLAERTFTDSKGQVFTTADDSKPKIIINGIGALSLYHLGLPIEQLVAVYDIWVVGGSDYDLDFDEPTNEFDSSLIIDPTEEEIAFLQQTTDLTKCTNTQLCTVSFDTDEFRALEGDFDYIVNLRASNLRVDQFETQTGQKILWLDDRYEHNTGCYDESDTLVDPTKCYGTSLIDVVRKYEELAEFLGIVPTEKVVNEKQAMCESAKEFVAHTSTLDEQGIYAVAATLRPQNGGELNWYTPISFPWLRTLEELGFPLLHPPGPDPEDDHRKIYSLAGWFPSCGDGIPICSNLTPAYPVDFWLWDTRTYVSIEQTFDDVVQTFPDPALQEKQYSFWTFHDGAVSYTNVRQFLDQVRQDSTGLRSTHTESLTCISSDVTSREHNTLSTTFSTIQAAPACRAELQSLYTECPDLGTETPAMETTMEEDDPTPITGETSEVSSSAIFDGPGMLLLIVVLVCGKLVI